MSHATSPTRLRLKRARILCVLATASIAAVEASGQTLPGGAGYQVGSGAIPVETAPPKGRGWWTSASVATSATLTNNANYGTADDRAGDLILEVTPALRFSREAARFRVNGYVALDMLGYVEGTQVNRILPKANVFANLEAVENLFFVDATLFADQFVENPFLPSSAASSTTNLYTSTQARIAPYLKGNIGQNVHWLVKSDNSFTWTSQSNNPLGNAYYARNFAEIRRDPTPFGITLRLTNDFTRVDAEAQPDQTLNSALLLLDYALSPQLTVGLRGGYENTTYTAEATAGPIYGASLSWRPSPITSLVGYWEERFFGPSYQWEFAHRQKRTASTLSFYRTVTTYPQVLFQIPPTNSVSGLLNSILTARFPDPVERESQVQDLIARQGLPQSLPVGTYVYNQSANILTGANANWALIGSRNTLAFNVFYLKTEYLPDARLPPSFLVFNNSIQEGAGITLAHSLSPVMTLNGTLSGQTTRGFGQTEGLNTRQGFVGLQANWKMSPRTTLFVGSRYQRQTTDNRALSATEQSEAAVFTGLIHLL